MLDEKPSILDAPKEAETPQLPEGAPTVEEKEPPQEIPQEVPKAQVKADVGLSQKQDPNTGTSDLNKP
jgi:hypothetical protein